MYSRGSLNSRGLQWGLRLGEASYRVRALDPDGISAEEFDEQVRKLHAERVRLKALPAALDRWEEQLTGDLYCGI